MSTAPFAVALTALALPLLHFGGQQRVAARGAAQVRHDVAELVRLRRGELKPDDVHRRVGARLDPLFHCLRALHALLVPGVLVGRDLLVEDVARDRGVPRAQRRIDRRDVLQLLLLLRRIHDVVRRLEAVGELRVPRP
jgi:hypothetical protein